MIVHKTKVKFIEILRGVSVFLVGYHHFSDRLPYAVLGAAGPPSLPFSAGKIGVYMFFLISGLLIAMSLERSKSIAEFYARRIARIWPLFVAASLIIFAFLQVFDPPVVIGGPKDFYEDHISVLDLIGQLFFLNDLGFDWVDGVFWSLLVELKFYLLIGLFAFAFKRRYALAFGVAALVLASADILLGEVGGPVGDLVSRGLHGVLIAQYLPIFAVGVMIHARSFGGVFVGNIVLASVQAVDSVSGNPSFELSGLLMFAAVFAMVLAIDAAVLKNRLMMFFGKYSYAIYLFHQMIGLTVISILAPTLGMDLSIVIAGVLIVGVAYSMSQLVEWRFEKRLAALLVRGFTLLRLDRATLDVGVAAPVAGQAEAHSAASIAATTGAPQRLPGYPV